MPYNLPGEVNPFEAPRAGIGEEAQFRDLADQDAETIRRAHLGREANVKSVGSLMYLGAIGTIIGMVAFALMAAGVIPMNANAQEPMDPATQKMLFAGIAALCLLGTVIYGGLGYGLTKLQVWARWTMVVLTSLGLLNNTIQGVVVGLVNPAVGIGSVLVGSLIPGFILWLLVSSKAGMVFSKEYKEIIRKTPHVKQKTSIIVKILVGILVAFILFIVIVAIVGGLARR